MKVSRVLGKWFIVWCMFCSSVFRCVIVLLWVVLVVGVVRVFMGVFCGVVGKGWLNGLMV